MCIYEARCMQQPVQSIKNTPMPQPPHHHTLHSLAMPLRRHSILALTALWDICRAQTSLPIPCCSVPVNNVPLQQRTEWCQMQFDTCNKICSPSVTVPLLENTCTVVREGWSILAATLTSKGFSRLQMPMCVWLVSRYE